MSYNSRSPAVKRLMKEAQELAEPTELYFAQPLEDNLFEWHFTIRGPEDTDFQGGIYHGRILLPSEYPMKPPNILLLTPNGRFEIKRKICLSISGYHPESWRPCWSIRTALLAIIGFMPTHGGGAIGSLEFSSEERKKLAKTSGDFVCPDCGPTKSILRPQTEASKKDREEAKTLAKQIDFQSEKQKTSTATTASTPAPSTGATVAAAATPTAAAAPLVASGATPGAPMALPPGVPAFSPWPYFYSYYAPFLLGQPGGAAAMPNMAMPNMAQPNRAGPLPFEQWLVQVKGYKAPDQAAAATEAAQPSPAPATQPTEPAQPPPPASAPSHSEPEAPARPSESASPDATAASASVDEADAKQTEEEEEPQSSSSARQESDDKEVEAEEEEEGEEEEEEEERPRAAPVLGEALASGTVTETDEWPMLSLFVISFLLVVVLLFNRVCMPFVYAMLWDL